MNALSTLQQGNKDTAGHPLDVHRVQVLVAGIGRWNQLGTVTAIPDTGTFDTATTAAVKGPAVLRPHRRRHRRPSVMVGACNWVSLGTAVAGSPGGHTSLCVEFGERLKLGLYGCVFR